MKINKVNDLVSKHFYEKCTCQRKGELLIITIHDFKGCILDLVEKACSVRDEMEKWQICAQTLFVGSDDMVVYTDFDYSLQSYLREQFGGRWLAYVWYVERRYIKDLVIKFIDENTKVSV